MNANLQQMYHYIYGNWFTMICHVYAELDIAGLLQENSKTSDQLAEQSKTDPGALQRFLRCAGALGLHQTEPESGKLSLSELGRLLCDSSPHSLRAAARLNGASYRYQPWGELLHYLKTGSGEGLSPTWEHGSLDYLQDKPEQLQVFEQAMHNLGKATYHSTNENDIIAQHYDFGSSSRILDIGCGSDALLHAILRQHQYLHGTMFDLQQVLSNVNLPTEGQALAGRLDKIAGDFYQSVPQGYDAYIMKNVIHNHPEDRCKTILSRIRQAMLASDKPNNKRLILFELVIQDNSKNNVIAKLMDMNLNLLVGGVERTYDDFEKLLGSAGFRLSTMVDLPGLERKALTAFLET